MDTRPSAGVSVPKAHTRSGPHHGIFLTCNLLDFNLLQNANKAVKNEPVVSTLKAVEPPASTHSDPEEPVSPAQVLSQSQAKARQKSSKSTKAHKTLKPPKTPKAPKTPKVKEGGKKKAKKLKESSLPLKASSFAALESHAKDILSKMDDSKKAKVSRRDLFWDVGFQDDCFPGSLSVYAASSPPGC